jgi:hypothetical protein
LPDGHVGLSGGAGSWQYAAVTTQGGDEIIVEAAFPAGSSADLIAHPRAEAFFHDVRVSKSGGPWRTVTPSGAGFVATECARACRVRYRFDLRGAASALLDRDAAMEWDGVLEAPPSTWLLHPRIAPAGVDYRLRVQTPEGTSFVTGTFPAREQGGLGLVYAASASEIAIAPYAAFGHLRQEELRVIPGVDIVIAHPWSWRVDEEGLRGWVARSAVTAARMFGCFPVRRVLVLLVPVPGERVRRGVTMGDGGASIIAEVGEQAGEAALAADAVLPHEMTHLFVPSVSRAHHWIEEGLALYFEPIARARAGIISPEELWSAFADEMPTGLSARPGDGLDDAVAWRRTYWGGALFCLLADLEIRRESHNRLGLEDAMRGLLARGGSVAQLWPFDQLLETADEAVGLHVLRSMYAALGSAGWAFDLSRLFDDLGVEHEGARVTLVDSAPLADLRRAITGPAPENENENTSTPTACLSK